LPEWRPTPLRHTRPDRCAEPQKSTIAQNFSFPARILNPAFSNDDIFRTYFKANMFLFFNMFYVLFYYVHFLYRGSFNRAENNCYLLIFFARQPINDFTLLDSLHKLNCLHCTFVNTSCPLCSYSNVPATSLLFPRLPHHSSWASASRPMPPASAFLHPSTSVRFRSIPVPDWGTLIPVPGWMQHEHFFSIPYWADWMPDSPAFRPF
jgi:hypothetical protein